MLTFFLVIFLILARKFSNPYKAQSEQMFREDLQFRVEPKGGDSWLEILSTCRQHRSLEIEPGMPVFVLTAIADHKI